MTTVICQHSGIEFEAASSRTKQHPLVAAFKNDAQKNDNYNLALQALDKARAAGGYTTIEQYMAVVNDIMTGKVQAKTAQANARRQAEQDAEKSRRENKAQREAQNRLLNANGFRWKKYDYGTEESWAPGGLGAGIGEVDGYAWCLVGPDGREVSLEDALAQIASNH